MDSTENMAKLVYLYVILFIYASDIVYLRRLQKSLKFAILVGKKSKICDFLVFHIVAEKSAENVIKHVPVYVLRSFLDSYYMFLKAFQIESQNIQE